MQGCGLGKQTFIVASHKRNFNVAEIAREPVDEDGKVRVTLGLQRGRAEDHDLVWFNVPESNESGHRPMQVEFTVDAADEAKLDEWISGPGGINDVFNANLQERYSNRSKNGERKTVDMFHQQSIENLFFECFGSKVREQQDLQLQKAEGKAIDSSGLIGDVNITFGRYGGHDLHDQQAIDAALKKIPGSVLRGGATHFGTMTNGHKGPDLP